MDEHIKNIKNTQASAYELADQYIETLKVGDEFKTSANYHMVYRGKRICEVREANEANKVNDVIDEMYEFQIINPESGYICETAYSKLGVYVAMSLHQKLTYSDNNTIAV